MSLGYGYIFKPYWMVDEGVGQGRKWCRTEIIKHRCKRKFRADTQKCGFPNCLFLFPLPKFCAKLPKSFLSLFDLWTFLTSQKISSKLCGI